MKKNDFDIEYRSCAIICKATGEGNILLEDDGTIRYYSIPVLSDGIYQPSHLYILSCESKQIKNKWVYDLETSNIYKAITVKEESTKFKRIIATSDPKLKLPKLSEEFLRTYSELGGIDEVLVAFKQIMKSEMCTSWYEYKLYKTKTNSIITKLTYADKTKAANKKLLLGLLNECVKNTAIGKDYVKVQGEKWIKENL